MASSTTSNNQTVSRLLDSFGVRSDIKAKIQTRAANILKDGFISESHTSIRERFFGVEEKCRVLNNNELADALVLRFDKLEQWQSRSKFDVISFLLHLADNPVQKTRLEDLQHSVPTTPPQLTWKDLTEDFPWEDETIWHSIDYAVSSSDGSDWSEQATDQEENRSEVSHEDDLRLAISGATVNDKLLSIVLENRKQHASKSLDSVLRYSERQLLRETLCMLQGLPCQIYQQHDDSIDLLPCELEGLSIAVVHNTLEPLCDIGQSITKLRQFTAKQQRKALLQAFQACLLELLQEFGSRLSKIEKQLTQPQEEACTLLTISNAIKSSFQPLKLVTQLVEKTIVEDNTELLLEALFESIIDRQSIGDVAGMRTVGRIFSHCFNIYLRPIETWLEEGILVDAQDFFIQRMQDYSTDLQLWQSQFSMILKPDGTPRVPHFLQSSAQQIFTTGKSVNLLQILDPEYNQNHSLQYTRLNIEGMILGSSSDFEPFQEQFHLAMTGWLDQVCRISELHVLRVLIEKSQLSQILLDLDYLYLSRNGAIMQQIAQSIFHRVDNNKRWLNKFWLTDLYQENLVSIHNATGRKVSVSISKSTPARSRSIRELTAIQINYELSPVASVVLRQEHLEILQKVSTFLLQLERASYLLDRLRIHQDTARYGRDSRPNLSLQLRLRWFVNQVRSYITLNVFQPTMQLLHVSLDKSSNLDELIKTVHSTFLDLQSGCLLAEPQKKTQNAVISILELAVLVADLCNTLKDYSREDSDSSEDDPDLEADTTSRVSSLDRPKLISKYTANYYQLLSFVISGMGEMTRTVGNQPLQVLLHNLQSEKDQT